MAINNPTGDFTYSSTNVADVIKQASSSLNSIVNSVKITGKGKLRDFAGMDVKNISTFETAVNKYYNDIKSIVEDFNADALVDSAFKGEVGSAVSDFLKSMKIIVLRYVEAIAVEKKEIQIAKENYVKGSVSLGSSVVSDSESIRSTAGNITLD